jgi:hypothetical protein
MSGHRTGPKSIEVRRWSDLGLEETIPITALFPGVAGIHPSGIRSTADGKYLVSPFYKPDGWPDSAEGGVVTFAFDEGKSRGVDPIARVSPYVKRTRLQLYSHQMNRVGNDEGHFAPILALAKGESFVIGTKSDLEEDAPYQEGKSHPYVIWVDAKGKALWQKSLRSGKTFVDYSGGSAVETPDGGVIAFLIGYIGGGAGGAARLVKLDRGGKVRWEWTSPVGAEARFPTTLQLLPSGRVLMKGHVGSGRAPWEGELDAKTGRLMRDEVGELRQ